MKKVAIYARVSTADQNTESQLMELRAFAQRREFEVYKEYVDQVTGAVSKRKDRADQYRALLADAVQKRFDVVLVWKFDRFARSVKALVEALELFDSLRIDFISATQNIDTTTAMGRMFFQIIGSFAEFEREMIVERVKAGISNARAKGVKLGRPKSSTGIQELRILDLHKQGLSITQIARMVNRSRAGVWLVIQRIGTGVVKNDVLASPAMDAAIEGERVRQGGIAE